MPVLKDVPLRAPPGESVMPDGSVPDITDHPYGGTPPEPVRACEYATPAVAATSVEVVVISKFVELIVNVKSLRVVVPALSVTRRVKPKVPVLLGVPVRAPLEETAIPRGRELDNSDQE